MATWYIRSRNYQYPFPLCQLPIVLALQLSKSSFSKISADSGTFSNFIADFSKARRPLFATSVLILF